MRLSRGGRPPLTVDVVIPSMGRQSLARLLNELALLDLGGGRVIVVDDRRRRPASLISAVLRSRMGGRLVVLEAGGRGPAAARNLGWQAASAPWVAFLDDDVVPGPGWDRQLQADLARLGPQVGGSQGVIVVPSALGRPTDWERSVRGLATARWATADMAYRRDLLERLGGFDERFPRAYREDADLALRALGSGWELVRGSRQTFHSVPAGGAWSSLARQAGNRDDAVMLIKHGRGWQRRAGAPTGRRPRHLATTAAGLIALAGLAGRRPRLAALAGGLWVAGTAEFALARMLPGSRRMGEMAGLALTSVLIPPLAAFQWTAGLLSTLGSPVPKAVLFDRDGTLIEDVPYNGDPGQVRPRPGARRALDRLRQLGVPIAVVSNQSGVARGLVTEEQVRAVSRRVEEMLGPIPHWVYCWHGPDEGCACRKPAPGLVLEAAARLGVRPLDCVVIGDIGSDVEAARAAGARAVLVPNGHTLPGEVRSAPAVARDLEAAVDMILGARP